MSGVAFVVAATSSSLQTDPSAHISTFQHVICVSGDKRVSRLCDAHANTTICLMMVDVVPLVIDIYVKYFRCSDAYIREVNMQYIPVAGQVDPSYLRPCMTLRSRREVSTIDHVNTRFNEMWQSDATIGTSTKLPYLDTAPLMSRTDYRKHGNTPIYKPGSGLDSKSGSYFDKYDVTTDPRNVVREMQNVVYEPVQDRGSDESMRLASRQFSGRWIPAEVTEESIQMRLRAGETLLPSLNDMKKIYR
jgi:hypothetical protein